MIPQPAEKRTPNFIDFLKIKREEREKSESQRYERNNSKYIWFKLNSKILFHKGSNNDL